MQSKELPTNVEKVLNLHYNDTGKIWLTAQKTLRKLTGLPGISLPLLLLIGKVKG